MENIDRFKDITINDKKFRMDLLPARTGNWVLNITLVGELYKESNFARAQDLILQNCWMYIEKDGASVPMKVLSADGRWNVKELEYDVDTANDLFDEAVNFNFGPSIAKARARNAAAKAEIERRAAEAANSPGATQDTNQPAFQTT